VTGEKGKEEIVGGIARDTAREQGHAPGPEHTERAMLSQRNEQSRE